MDTPPEEFDEPSVIWATPDKPGQLSAYIDEALARRISAALAEMDIAHGRQHFHKDDGEPLLWGVSINTPLKDALLNGFQVVEHPSVYDRWIAILEEGLAFLRSEKAEYEHELATTMCSQCGHSLATHLQKESPYLACASPECLCEEFPIELREEKKSPHPLRLIKGGKLTKDQ
jgi:hypothetical protein